MGVLAWSRTVLVGLGRRWGQPLVGGIAALLAGVLCIAGWSAQTALPDFYQRHCFGLRLAPHWYTVWGVTLLATAAFWCIHSVILFSRALAIRTVRRSLWVVLGATQLAAAVATNLFVWLELGPGQERFVVSREPVEIHGETYRALRIEAMSRRRGRRRPVVAWLERKVGSINERLRVSHGQPWTTASGGYRITLDHAEVTTHGAIVRHGRQRVELTTNQPALAGSDTLVLHGVQNPGTDSATTTPKADISIGNERTLLPLDPEWTGEDALLGLKESPVLVLRAHKRVASLLALSGLGCLAFGSLMLVAARRLRRVTP